VYLPLHGIPLTEGLDATNACSWKVAGLIVARTASGKSAGFVKGVVFRAVEAGCLSIGVGIGRFIAVWKFCGGGGGRGSSGKCQNRQPQEANS